MVQAQSPKLLPEWLMFLHGVVDSEDIPLNLSRELLQESVVISKIKSVITGKMIAYLNRQAKRDPGKYEEFYREFGRFLRIGIVTTNSQTEKEDLAKLLRFESSKEEKGVLVSLDQYIERAPDGQKQVYYLSAPSRDMAMESPYFETLQVCKTNFYLNLTDFKFELFTLKLLTATGETSNVLSRFALNGTDYFVSS